MFVTIIPMFMNISSIEEDTENARRNFFAPQKKGATAVNLTLSFPWGWDSFFFESK